jgi:hypothetical protein
MTLLVEALALLLAGVAIAWLLRRARRAVSWPGGVAAVVVTGAVVLLAGYAWKVCRSFRASAAADAALTEGAALVAGGAGTNVGFLSWAHRQIESGHMASTFWLTPSAARENSMIYQWSSYQLLPARAVDSPRQANWVLLYGVTPSAARYDRGAFGRLLVFSSDYALAERTHAG